MCIQLTGNMMYCYRNTKFSCRTTGWMQRITDGRYPACRQTEALPHSNLSRGKSVAYQSEGKAIPVTGRQGPQGCETSRLPHLLDNRFTDSGDVSLTRQPSFTPQEDSWYSFLLEAESTPGPQCS
jgi:hypothetical protein